MVYHLFMSINPHITAQPTQGVVSQLYLLKQSTWRISMFILHQKFEVRAENDIISELTSTDLKSEPQFQPG